MVRVSRLISCWTCIQVTRSRKPIRPSAMTAIGTNIRPRAAIFGSSRTISVLAPASSNTSVRHCIIPFWMNIRAPSRSSMPRVIRSPEWILS